MSKLLNSQGKSVVEKMILAIQENKEYLSEADGAIGDGDHGVNMNKGFTICQKRLEGKDFSFSDALALLGDVLLTEIGGSMGPIYGTMFIEMSGRAAGTEEIDAALFSEMLKSALNGLYGLVDARAGDKTLMDVIIPAQAAFEQAASRGKTFKECLDMFAAAAKAGRDSTKDMIAKFGRASRLGERSRGVLDAGSVSCALILETMANGIKEYLQV